MSIKINFSATPDRNEIRENIHIAYSSTTGPRIVVWDLSKISKIPWQELLFVAKTLKSVKPLTPLHITKSIVCVPNNSWKNVLNVLFMLSKPAAPVEIEVLGTNQNDVSFPSYNISNNANLSETGL